jgi:DtxR family Mn-dependent transcriptional regulator
MFEPIGCGTLRLRTALRCVMATSTVEDYIKAIYALQHDLGEAPVVRLAAALGVTKGTVTSMVHKLRDAGLARAERYGGVTLTPKGQRLALDVIRRHRLIEVFLVRTLKFDWSEVHEEAERLEHAVSRKFLERLDAFLGKPTIDPHGDPIPDAHGRLSERDESPLSDLARGARGVITRVSDQDPGFLGFAARHGLVPGARVAIVERIAEAESISVRCGRAAAVALSMGAAGKVLVLREHGRRGARTRSDGAKQDV